MTTLPKSRKPLIAVIAAAILGLVAIAVIFRDELGMKSLSGPVAVTTGGPVPGRGLLGARLEESSGPATISGVLPASAAAEAGLLPGDVILAIDSNNIANAAEAGRAMVSKSPGDEIAIRFQRGSESRDLRIKLK